MTIFSKIIFVSFFIFQGLELIPGFETPTCIQKVIDGVEEEPEPTTKPTEPTTKPTEPSTTTSTIVPERQTGGSEQNSFDGILLTLTCTLSVIQFNF